VDAFLVLSDSPIQVDPDRWRSVLMAYKIDGKPVFDREQPGDLDRLDEMLAYARIVTEPRPDTMEYMETLRQRLEGRRLVTDDNMGTEWQQ
jgi:hypothetical protein